MWRWSVGTKRQECQHEGSRSTDAGVPASLARLVLIVSKFERTSSRATLSPPRGETKSQAQSTRRVYGVLRHVLANGSASFQSHPNHANTFRPNPADRAIPHTKDLRAETGSFGAFKPNTFTCARYFFISRARERVWKGMCQLRLLAFAGMIGREGSSRLHHSDQEMGDPSVLERRLLGAAA